MNAIQRSSLAHLPARGCAGFISSSRAAGMGVHYMPSAYPALTSSSGSCCTSCFLKIGSSRGADRWPTTGGVQSIMQLRALHNRGGGGEYRSGKPPPVQKKVERLDYRHSFHAGNNADCFKHVLLMLVLKKMLLKDNPMTYVRSPPLVARLVLLFPPH
jgi:hypothetical protein